MPDVKSDWLMKSLGMLESVYFLVNVARDCDAAAGTSDGDEESDDRLLLVMYVIVSRLLLKFTMFDQYEKLLDVYQLLICWTILVYVAFPVTEFESV